MRVLSFSYKFNTVPMRLEHEHLLVLDARTVKNPYVHGTPDEEMRRTVLHDPAAGRLIERGTQFLTDVPGGTVAVGCSYGRHRSVAIADAIAEFTGAPVEHLSPGSNGVTK